MRIELSNIGKIKEAKIKIDGITVIAGENNTGKSTVGKVLFAVFNSLHNTEYKTREEKRRSVSGILRNTMPNTINAFFKIGSKEGKRLVDDILDEKNNSSVRKLITSFISSNLEEGESVSEERVNEGIARINEVRELTSNEVLKSIVSQHLNDEFRRQITNIYNNDDGRIALHINPNTISIAISGNKVISLNNEMNLKKEAVYLDDPFILDEVNRESHSFFIGEIPQDHTHKAHLKRKLLKKRNSNVIDGILADRRLDEIYKKINTIDDGDLFISENESLGYKKRGSDKVLFVYNLSTGLKTFVIIKELLSNGSIEQNGTIILDEPEIHLHPEWQLVLAELVVLLHSVFGLHVLLNTHSPYFLSAIESYSEKHGVSDKCHYYFAQNDENGNSVIQEVSDNIEIIYKGLARPLQVLENMRDSDD